MLTKVDNFGSFTVIVTPEHFMVVNEVQEKKMENYKNQVGNSSKHIFQTKD